MRNVGVCPTTVNKNIIYFQILIKDTSTLSEVCNLCCGFDKVRGLCENWEFDFIKYLHVAMFVMGNQQVKLMQLWRLMRHF